MSKKNSKINELILTFFYCGKAKYAPGTFGTIGALLFWIFVNNYFIEEMGEGEADKSKKIYQRRKRLDDLID